MNNEKTNFLQGFVYYIEPDTGFINSETNIQGTATITKVSGVFGELYKTLKMSCTPDWEVMSELDITYRVMIGL